VGVSLLRGSPCITHMIMKGEFKETSLASRGQQVSFDKRTRPFCQGFGFWFGDRQGDGRGKRPMTKTMEGEK